jgi:hypothetical protein
MLWPPLDSACVNLRAFFIHRLSLVGIVAFWGHAQADVERAERRSYLPIRAFWIAFVYPSSTDAEQCTILFRTGRSTLFNYPLVPLDTEWRVLQLDIQRACYSTLRPAASKAPYYEES